ncbi:MAG: hypothetical protein HFH35_02990 [Eubacterium sp.]|nr:hypothetical protein [Eubacterium sp.]
MERSEDAMNVFCVKKIIAKSTLTFLLMLCVMIFVLPVSNVYASMPGTVQMNINEVRRLTTTSGKTNYRWSWTNHSVISVNGNGSSCTVRALKKGSAFITVTYKIRKPQVRYDRVSGRWVDGFEYVDQTDTCSVLVVDPATSKNPLTLPSNANGRKGENISGTIEDIGSFSNGLVPVKRKGLWGYADDKLRLVIPFQYKAVNDFNDAGMASVLLEDIWCVIDKNQKIIYRDSGAGFPEVTACNTYILVRRFYDSDRTAWSWEMYDLKGQPISSEPKTTTIKHNYAKDELNYKGLDATGNYWLFVSPTNENKIMLKVPVIQGMGVYNTPYKEGLFIIWSESRSKYGAADKTGKIVVPCNYDKLYSPYNGYLPYKQGTKCGLLKSPLRSSSVNTGSIKRPIISKPIGKTSK